MTKKQAVNVVGVSGLVLIGAGSWMLSPAWSLVLIGSILFVTAAVGARA